MEYRIENLAEITLVHITGRIDSHSVSPLMEWMERPPARVGVDLAQVNFIDSSGLAALVRGMKRCRQQGGDLLLYGLQSPVRIIFELTRMDRAFEIKATQDEVLSSLAAQT